MSALCGNSLFFSRKRNKQKYRKPKLKKKRHANLPLCIPQRGTPQFKMEMIECTDWDIQEVGCVEFWIQ